MWPFKKKREPETESKPEAADKHPHCAQHSKCAMCKVTGHNDDMVAIGMRWERNGSGYTQVPYMIKDAATWGVHVHIDEIQGSEYDRRSPDNDRRKPARKAKK